MRGRARTALPLVVLAVAIVVAALVAGPGPDGLPLDPRSTAPDGTKALVDTLEELGARVRLTTEPRAGDDVALLLTDVLGDEGARDRLGTWVEDGGLLVVSDGMSPLTPEPLGGTSLAGFVQAPIELGCDVPALAAAGEVQPGSPSVVYELPPGAVGCYPRNEGFWLVASERGEGVVVALGGPEVVTNAQLATGDHGVLMASLLAPEPGTSVAFVRPPRPGEGQAGLADLIAPGVRAGLWQVLVAFLLLAAWRSRRLGRPLEEYRPVRIPGSELVVAVGNLLQQTRASRRAALLLRQDLHRVAAERLGVPAATDPERLAEAVAQRTGADAGDARGVLTGPLPADDEGMVAFARSVEHLRAAITGSRSDRATSGVSGARDGGAGEDPRRRD